MPARLVFRPASKIADALFDLLGQPVAILVGREIPDQDPAHQYGHREQLEKQRGLFPAPEFFHARPIRGVTSVKETDDLEKRAVEKHDPSGI